MGELDSQDRNFSAPCGEDLGPSGGSVRREVVGEAVVGFQVGDELFLALVALQIEEGAVGLLCQSLGVGDATLGLFFGPRHEIHAANAQDGIDKPPQAL
ncbi:MAG: hypothetical protein HKL95_03250, partial [Phycisphaerae bacterium]|nr:hypothetical protein [Phycisphaerae bacterium]